MINPADFFEHARLKHRWAHYHIDQFHRCWQGFLKTDFCRVVAYQNADGEQIFRAEATGEIPAEIVVRIGDAVHNLKCALDYTISELLGGRSTRLTFPMAQTREELERTFSTTGLDPCEACGRGGKGRGGNALIEMAIPGIGQFIVENIRPYRDAGGFLWPLNRLDNRDKHRFLVPVIVPQTLSNVVIREKGGGMIRYGRVTIEAGGRVNLATVTQPQFEIESYDASAEIFFNEIGAVEGQPVLPTLLNMGEAVGETIDAIAEFALSAGWRPMGR